MTYNYCNRHNQRYTHECWQCEYERHLPEEHVHGWGNRMDRALAVNKAAHDAILRDAGLLET